MGPPPCDKRFRINPVEVIVLMIIGGLLLHSSYRLLRDSQNGMHLEVFSPLPVNRGIASTIRPFQNLEIHCGEEFQQQTEASKIRLIGPLCHLAEAQATPPSTLKVKNAANQFTATVFTDRVNQKFFTDYIPLARGDNPIRVEFQYPNGKSTSQDLIVMKN